MISAGLPASSVTCGMLQDIARANGHELDQAGMIDMPRLHEIGVHETERSLEPRDTERRKLEFALLLECRMRSMIGCDHVDRTVSHRFDERSVTALLRSGGFIFKFVS